MAKSYAVRYVNHAGAEYVLQGDGLSFVDVSPLFAFSWSYGLANRLNGMGGKASSFARDPRTVSLTVRVRGFTREQFLERMNTLHAVSDADNLAEMPGRLYVGDQYMVCFLAVAADAPAAARNGNYCTMPITVLAERPFWCNEKTYTFNPSAGELEEDETGKKYNLRYPYRYGSGLAITNIKNTHYAACPAIITIYGPCANPAVSIGNNIYNVDVTLASSQRLVIDGTENEIYTVGSDGTITSVFNRRNKAYDIFKPVPVGETNVLYSGEYLMTITLVEQRSQLKWTL